MMNDTVFTVFITVLVIILLLAIGLSISMIIANKKLPTNESLSDLRFSREYKNGIALSDHPNLAKAEKIIIINDNGISYSDTGITGKFIQIWRV